MDGIVALTVGLAGALILTPTVRRAALRYGIVDRPGALKTHAVPVAYLGGVAVFLAIVPAPVLGGHPWVIVPVALALALGLVDDLRPLPVPTRIAAELGIATVAALTVPGPLLARIATGALTIGLLNAVNLLDGQDGLAAGVGAIAAVGFATLGGAATPIGLGLAGALLGFLVWNRPPARIYLGDAGAYMIGTTLAVLPAMSSASATTWSIWWAVPLLVAVPVADTAIAIARRWRSDAPLLQGDRSHVYDQLVDRGLSVWQSSAIGWLAQAGCTGVGVAAAHLQPVAALATTLLAAPAAIAAADP